MKMYLWNGSAYLASSDYPNTLENPPYPASAGWQWVEGDLPQGAQPYVEIPLSQKLTSQFETLMQHHIGQSYCTNAVILSIVQIQSGILLNADNSMLVGLSKGALAAFIPTLPQQMWADANSILALFP